MLYGFDIWTLNSELKGQIDAFTEPRDFSGMAVSNRIIFRDNFSRLITCIVLERHLRPFGHMARYLEVDPVHREVSVRDNP